MIESREGFKILPYETKEYLNNRSIHERLTPMNIYTRSHMTDQMPSEDPVIPMKRIIKMVIFKPVGVISEHIKFTLINLGFNYNCLLWSKLNEQVGSEVPSEIGPNGNVTGNLQFSLVKFGDGVCYKIPTGGMNQDYVSYGLLPVKNEGTIEAWINLKFPIVNGRPPSYQNFVVFWTTSEAPKNYIALNFDGGQGLVVYYHDGTKLVQIKDNTIDFDAATNHHLVIGWSRSASLPDGKTLALYIDGIRTASSEESLSDNEVGINLQILKRITTDTEGYVDQLKIYPSVEYLQGILDNRIYEGFAETKNYGYIYDKNNQYVFENEIPVQRAQILRVQLVDPEPVQIPFRYSISVEWEDNNFMIYTDIIRLPEMILEPGGDIDFYLSTDFSAYWDSGLWRLAGTDIM